MSSGQTEMNPKAVFGGSFRLRSCDLDHFKLHMSDITDKTDKLERLKLKHAQRNLRFCAYSCSNHWDCCEMKGKSYEICNNTET